MDINLGLCAIGAAIAMTCGNFSALGEAWICCHTIDGMVRNPEMFSKLRSTMMIGVALTESTGIYSLITAILIIFVLGLR